MPHSEVELQHEFKSFTTTHLGSNTSQKHGLNSLRHKHQIQLVSLCQPFSTSRESAIIQSGWQCSRDFQEQDGCHRGSVRAMRRECASLV